MKAEADWICMHCGTAYQGPRCPSCKRSWSLREDDLLDGYPLGKALIDARRGVDDTDWRAFLWRNCDPMDMTPEDRAFYDEYVARYGEHAHPRNPNG